MNKVNQVTASNHSGSTNHINATQPGQRTLLYQIINRYKSDRNYEILFKIIISFKIKPNYIVSWGDISNIQFNAPILSAKTEIEFISLLVRAIGPEQVLIVVIERSLNRVKITIPDCWHDILLNDSFQLFHIGSKKLKIILCLTILIKNESRL